MREDYAASMSGCDVLVTGATGFVGGHVIERARAQGLSVSETQGDLRRPTVAHEAVASANPQAVIHLAAAPRDREPWRALADDLAMAGALLSAIGSHAPGTPVLIAGSAAQYGMAVPRRLTEDDPTVPVSSYGANKCVLERAVIAAPLRGPVRVIFARSFNHIGPRQGKDAPAVQWVRQVIDAGAIGSGRLRTGKLDVVRDFVDVRDVADAYLSLVRSSAEGVVNVCSGVPVSLRSVAQAVMRASGFSLTLEYDPALARSVDPPYVVGDPRRIHDITGWAPQISLDRSIGDLLDACRGPQGAAEVVTS